MGSRDTLIEASSLSGSSGSSRDIRTFTVSYTNMNKLHTSHLTTNKQTHTMLAWVGLGIDSEVNTCRNLLIPEDFSLSNTSMSLTSRTKRLHCSAVSGYTSYCSFTLKNFTITRLWGSLPGPPSSFQFLLRPTWGLAFWASVSVGLRTMDSWVSPSSW